MKSVVLTLVIVLTGLLVNGQNFVTTKYFKDFEGRKVIEKKEKAKFKEVTSSNEDGSYKVEFFDMGNEKVLRSKSYRDDQPIGVWKSFDQSGKLISERDFDQLKYSDEMVRNVPYFEFSEWSEEDIIPAYYKSKSTTDFNTYVGQKIKYPNEAKDSGAQGNVMVHVKIDKTGKAEVISIFKGVDPFLDYESYRVINGMSGWTPATEGGAPVDSYTIIPVKFKML